MTPGPVLAKARGDHDLMRQRLQQCVDVGSHLYMEHVMAGCLLAQE